MRFVTVPFFTGVLALSLGLLGTYRWVAREHFLLDSLPYLNRFAPNTALCLALLGVGLLLADTRPAVRRTGQVAVGGLVSLVSGAVLLQYAIRLPAPHPAWQFLINATPDGLPAPMQMAPSTALALLLLGTAFLIRGPIRGVRGPGVALALAMTAALIALLNAVGLFSSLDQAFALFRYAQMSPPAIAGILLVVAGFLAQLRRSQPHRLWALPDDRRIALISGGLFLFAALATALLVFAIAWGHMKEALIKGIERTQEERAHVLLTSIQGGLEYARSISASRPLLRQRLARIAAGGGGQADLRDIQKVLDDVAALGPVAAVRLADPKGRVVGVRGKFSQGDSFPLRLPEPFVGELRWGDGFVERVTLPLFEAGSPIGTLTADLRLQAATEVARSLTGLGGSGEMRLCIALSATEMRCFPSRHQPVVTVMSRVLDGKPLPMSEALDGLQGKDIVRDYRDDTVVAVFGPVGNTGIGMVLKMDEAELMAPLLDHSMQVVVVVVGMALLGVWVTAWWVAPLTRAVTQSRDRLRSILDNMADSVLVCTPQGVVESANPAAVRLLSRQGEDIAAKTLHSLLGLACTTGCGRPGGECSALTNLAVGSDIPQELSIRTGEGDLIPVEIVASPVRRGEAHYIVVLRDLRERKRAEAALRESEQRFRSTFEQAAVGIAHVSPDGRFLRVNRKLGDILGYAPAELLAMTFREVMHPEHREKSGQAVRKLLAGEVGTYTAERLALRKDGTLVWTQGTNSLVHPADGKPAYIVTVVEDISERKHIEQERRESEALFRATFEQAAVGIVHVAPQGHFLRINQRFCDIVDYTCDEMLARTFRDITHPDDLDLDLGYMRQALAGEIRNYRMEKRYFRRDGSIVWADLTVSLLRRPDGTPDYFIGVVEDITGRKRLEAAVQESNARLRSVTANLPGMVYRLRRDAKGTPSFPYASEGCFSVCGISADELQEDAGRLFDLMEAQDRERFLERIEASELTLSPFDWEGQLLFSPADVKWVNFRATPAPGKDGAVSWDGMAFNITATKRNQIELQESRSRLQELTAHLESVREEERGRIAHEVHDELGQWLTVLKMDVSWLMNQIRVEPAILAGKMAAMSDVVDSTIGVVRRIAADLRPAVLDLGLPAALEWLTEEFGRRTGLACGFDWDSEDVVLDMAQVASLYRITQEALTNVLRHAQADTVIVALHNHHDFLELEILDNGQGIPPEGERKRGSYGLFGMRERARAIGAEMTIEGMAGQGTRVHVRLPIEALQLQ